MKTQCVGRNDPCPCGSGKKFKHCCLGKENSTSSSHGAAGMPETLRRALEGRQCNSLKEAQAFLEQITQQQNRRPLDEFHGLSPEQMHRILNFPFASPGLLRYNLKTIRAYLLKEDFNGFWEYVSPAWAEKFLDRWCTRVMRSKIEPMNAFYWQPCTV